MWNVNFMLVVDLILMLEKKAKGSNCEVWFQITVVNLLLT